MALTSGTDYLFFSKVDLSKQSLTAALARGFAVCTPNQIAVFPTEAYGTLLIANVFTTYRIGSGDPAQAVQALLADPAMDVPRLERALADILGGDKKTRWVFPLDGLEKLKMSTGFFGMATLKMPSESVRRLVIRDKGGKAAAKAFYAARL